MPSELTTRGQQITLYHSSADAHVALPVTLYDVAQQHSVGLADDVRLALDSLVLSVAVAGDSYVFFDQANNAIAITAASTSADTFTVAGDLTEAFQAGDTFYVYGSTGNDGVYVVDSSAYNPGTGTTTITPIGAVANGTADGKITTHHKAILDANDTAKTLAFAGDYRELFRVGRTFQVDGSTGNDNSGTPYTVTAVSYSASTNRTTVTVASLADGTDDGYIIPLPTALDGCYLWRGQPANTTQVVLTFPSEIALPDCCGLWILAAAGSIDVTGQGWLRKTIERVNG